jgi:hypothetical protein
MFRALTVYSNIRIKVLPKQAFYADRSLSLPSLSKMRTNIRIYHLRAGPAEAVFEPEPDVGI